MIQYNNIGGGGGMSLSLTTIGNSGPSTLVGNVLNVPDYSTNPPIVPSLQQVTDIGYQTTNPIFINNQSLLVNFNIGGFNGYGLYTTTNLQFVNTDTAASFELQFNGARMQSTNITVPDIALNGYLPLSVNGSFADSTGNISLNVNGVPAPPDTSIQFNNNGVFGGSSNFTYDYNQDICAIVGRLTSIFSDGANTPTNGQFFQTNRTITGIASPSNSYGFTTSYYLDLNQGHINGSELYNFPSIFAGVTINGNDGVSSTQPIRSLEASLTVLSNPILLDDFRFLDVKKGDHSASFGTSFITNCYGLKLADQFNATGFSITNSWAIYQEGTNDLNYFAGNVGIQGTPTVRPLYVNDAIEYGAAAISATFGSSSGDYLIVWVAGNEYRIDLLKPS